MSYQDKHLTCSDCRRSFAFSAEDQQLSGELGYARPGRCRDCWRAREDRRRGEESSSAAPSRLLELRGPNEALISLP
jgi:hypothetical protein